MSYLVGLNGGDRSRAHDVVQETLLRAWRNAPELEQIGGYRRGWLMTVAKHVVIDQWRAASRRPELLRRLSTEHRQVLFLAYFCDASVEDAAAAIGVPPGTVKSRTHYALRALRKTIEGSYEHD